MNSINSGTETMQEYIRKRCNEIDARYNQQEYDSRTQKNTEILNITEKKNKQIKANQKTRSIVLVVAEIITFLVCGEALNKMSTSNNGDDFFKILIIVIGICVAEYFLLNAFFRNINKQAERNAQVKIDSLEQEHGNTVQQLTVKKSSEKKLFEAEINNQMNQYRKVYEQSAACTYIVGWILNVLSNEITKADRSQWLPQVKANVRFIVNYNFIEIPGFGKYDMASQGIQIDNNPMAVGALAYVLENRSLAEARKRFQLDPNGGRPVIVSTRNDVHVELQYSAPNGRGMASR